MPQKPLDRRRAEWKSSERIRFVKVKSTPYLMVEFNLSKWNFRFQSTYDFDTILIERHISRHTERKAQTRINTGFAPYCFVFCFLLERTFSNYRLPFMFSRVSMTTTQSGSTCCMISFMMFSGTATQPPV